MSFRFYKNIYHSTILLTINLLFVLLSSNLLSQTNKLKDCLIYDTTFSVVDKNFDINRTSYQIVFPYFFYFNQGERSVVAINILTNKKKLIDAPKSDWVYINCNNEYLSIISYVNSNKWLVKNYLITNDDIFLEVESQLSDYNDYYFYAKGIEKVGHCYSSSGGCKSQININENELQIPFQYCFLTHMDPNNYIDFTNDLNLFAQASSYRIEFFNNDLKKVSEIMYNNKLSEEEELKLKKIKKKYDPINPKEIFKYLQSFRKDLSLNWRAEFINDSSVFVCRRESELVGNGINNNKYDLWKYKNGKWAVKYFGLKSVFPEDSEIIGEDCLPFTLNEYGSRFIVQENKLYVLKMDIPNEVFGKTVKKNNEEKNSWLETKDPILKIYTYEFK